MATLYTWAGNTNAAAVQATAALNGANVKVADFVPGTAPAGFADHASAPVMTTACGQNLTQFSAIMAAVNGKSCPQTLEWVGFAENVVTPAASAWTFPTLGAMPNNKGVVAEGKKVLLAALAHLNEYLATKTYLVGERASAADAAVVASLSLAFKQVLAPEYRKECPHVVRWFQTCVAKMPAFGAHTLAEKEAQYDGKTYGELNKKADNKKQAKAKAPKKEAAPKKVEAAKAAPTADEAIAAAAAAKKAKDPWFGVAEAGKYDFDAWKRCYSNNDTVPTAMDYFWENFDKENYSLWFCKYKYGHEVAMPFMASNLIRGFFQRIEKMRKNSFANLCVFGGEKKGDIEIQGVWFWKGQGLAFELCEDWNTDYDCYSWEKLDSDKPEHRLMVQEYFAWEGKFDGKTFYEGKTWK
jgi:elongation factor 1-gamma